MSDAPVSPEKRPTRRRETARRSSPAPLIAFLTAVQFLLISPAFIKRPFSARELGAAVAYYPLVGLILGGVLLGANYFLALFTPPLVRAALTLALWVILTGALHLDGFLDACDGLLGGYTPESRMEIMRDERVGAFALAGGVLLLLVKFSAMSALPPFAPALLLAPVLSRCGMAVALVAFPYARAQGLGRAVKDHAHWGEAAAALVITSLISALVYWYWGNWRIGLALVAAALTVWFGARYTLRRIPGLTGDIYGALNELVEAIVLLTLVNASI